MGVHQGLLRAEKKRSEALSLAAKADKQILSVHTKKALSVNPDYKKLLAEEVKLRHQLHMQRLRINKKLPKAIQEREVILAEMKKTLETLKEAEAISVKHLETVINRRRSLEHTAEQKVRQILERVESIGSSMTSVA